MIVHLLIENEGHELLKRFSVSEDFRVHLIHKRHAVFVIVPLFIAREVFLNHNVLI